jgi:hypothetical protein
MSVPAFALLKPGYGLVGRAAVFSPFVIGQRYDPDVFGPLARPHNTLIPAFFFFSPPGFVCLAIAGIVHRARSKPRIVEPA